MENFLLHILFYQQWEDGKSSLCSHEHSQIKWFSRSELEAIPLASYKYLNIIDAWVKR